MPSEEERDIAYAQKVADIFNEAAETGNDPDHNWVIFGSWAVVPAPGSVGWTVVRNS